MLILLAISFAIVLAVIAWHFSIYALSFMVGLQHSGMSMRRIQAS